MEYYRPEPTGKEFQRTYEVRGRQYTVLPRNLTCLGIFESVVQITNTSYMDTLVGRDEMH
jgi:hypothetical protein